MHMPCSFHINPDTSSVDNGRLTTFTKTCSVEWAVGRY